MDEVEEEEEEVEDQAEVEVAMELEDVDAEVEAVLCTTVLVTLSVMITVLGGCQGSCDLIPLVSKEDRTGVVWDKEEAVHEGGRADMLFLQVAVGLPRHTFRNGSKIGTERGLKVQTVGASQ